MYRRIVFAVAIAVVTLDQVTKALAVVYLESQPPVPLLGSFLQLAFARNPGAAFSIGTGMTWVFSALALAVAAVVVRTSHRLIDARWAWCLGGVLGGAVGNLLDRLFRSPGPLRGHVVDFIMLPNYPLFNVADSAIVCAAVGIALLTIRNVEPTA